MKFRGFQTFAVRWETGGPEFFAEITISRGVLVKAYAVIIVIVFCSSLSLRKSAFFT
jgi:hypothetical protein